MTKIRVGVIFGGRSAEHEVSLLSARNIVEALDRNKYDVTLIGIDKKGGWHIAEEDLLTANSKKSITDKAKYDTSNRYSQSSLPSFVGSEPHLSLSTVPRSNNDNRPYDLPQLDVVFPVLHGTFGEDGAIQGLLKILDIPFVGPSILSSAVGMDKDVAKRLLRDAGIDVARFVSVPFSRRRTVSFKELSDELGLPIFVKPANLGSSVGISKVTTSTELEHALQEAFKYDTKIIVEEYIKGREIEVSVLGNEEPIASVPGEIIPTHDFYSYEAKYLDSNGARFVIPANLDEDTTKQVERLAIQTYQCLCCEGMARVDMFLTECGRLLINEINTIPGFTSISMYPKLWEASGIPYGDLIEKLLKLAIDRHERDSCLSRDS
jgi:D-alanine-D-alanine ligase